MRSLLLAASFPPALGGVETLLYQTSRRLREPPLILAPAPAAAADLDVRSVPPDVPMRLAYRPLWGLHPSLHYVQRFWTAAFRAARAHRPQVIQAGHVYLAPMARVLSRRLDVPYVVYAYGQEVWRGGRRMGLGALDERLRGRALRAADRVLVPGRFTASLLNDWSIEPRKVVAVPYGADPRPPAPLPEGNTLLTVARLIPRKGIDTVISALDQLPDGIHYRVVGSGPDEGRLRKLADPRRVNFLGRLDDAELEHEYRAATLFVLPARRTGDGGLEGYGLVYFEAAAWGRPVIAGRSGGEIDAVVDGQTGILVDGTSVDDVASTIASLLADPARLEALGAAGRARVEATHNWASAAAVVDGALAELT